MMIILYPSVQCMKCYMTAVGFVFIRSLKSKFVVFFFKFKESVKGNTITCLRLDIFGLVFDCHIDQNSHCWMLKP